MSASAFFVSGNTDYDVVMMDISLSGNKKDGILAELEILQIKNDVKIIMLTSLTEQEIMRDSFIADAVNYINKDDYLKIPDAIRTTIAEKEILDLVEKGYTHSQISKELYKSEHTIKNQINMMLKKLGVSNCKQALEKIKMRGDIGANDRLVS